MPLHPDLDDLSLWTVYDHPRDFPDHFVARRFSMRSGKPTSDVLTAPTLALLRKLLQDGVDYRLTRLERAPDDDPVIVETWL